jgi:hypothetical protein
MKRKKTADLVSVSWLANHHHHDRATITSRLQGVPFVSGRNRAKLYDREIARAAIESRDGDMASLVRERAHKARIEREIRQIQLAERQKNMVPSVFVTDLLAGLAAALRSEIESWPCPESEKLKAHLSIEKASIEAAKLTGADVSAREADWIERQRKLLKDIAEGRVPYHWFDRFRPENHARVWSIELGRYYSKKEIIAKFGRSGTISPIDEILDEVEAARTEDLPEEKP